MTDALQAVLMIVGAALICVFGLQAVGGWDALMAAIPMAAQSEPEDIAEGVVWLASDESRFVTGTDLHIDGGWAAT